MLTKRGSGRSRTRIAGFSPLTEDTARLLANLQNRRPEGYPYVLVPPERYDHIQEKLRKTGRWTLCHAKISIVHNFKRQFDKILAKAGVKKGTFHDIRRTAITNWFYQGLSIYDVMKLAGTPNLRLPTGFISR